ncbi:TetR family transcriptional regulator [Actinobacteria bacterium YIM 96077]|uniref:TetR family transcriptional regulator n=1 Tax=Phytoactinopolyspora halophila TaxID=1981511 RepID=A0A329QF79_9ACTN|nr:TetR/AcrR family transcriptional regulator C-terminal domain-containing protein [Phytoactinopolyspora halophila]AYY13103.1 TetR family transcriptional regulator [Actinobacteria bacterium YIM 96077]RAW11115.1 TetR family transcriptional regulator [Phytoactinopolyspora halophila]
MERRERMADTGKTSLTPRTVIEAALSLADSEGLGAVTIRRLATDLGVTPMALYWHFRNKDDLLDGMVDRIFEKIDPTVRTSDPWPEQLRTLLGSMLDVLRSHPSTAPLLSTRSATSESSLRITETLLDILRRGGFSPTEATQVARHALSTLTNLVSAMPGSALGEESEDAQRRARVFLESLPPERYPRLVEAAVPLSECEDPEGYFAFGLDLLLAGIEATARRTG